MRTIWLMSAVAILLGLSGCGLSIKIFGPNEEVVVGSEITSSDFKFTPGTYDHGVDFGDIIDRFFGSEYRLADWNDIFRFRDNLVSFFDAAAIREGERYFVTWGGDTAKWDHNNTRYYFIRGGEKSRALATFDEADLTLMPDAGLYNSGAFTAHILVIRSSAPPAY